MDTLVIDPRVSARLIEERRARGADRFDEVWEGVYVMSPAPNDEHQDLVGGFIEVLRTIVDRRGRGKTRPGINLANNPDDWEHDYRVPDVAVFLNESPAVCHGTFWTGPVDFLVEIISPWDKTRDKLEFYGITGAREVLVVDRDPWQLELYGSGRSALALTSQVAVGDAAQIASTVLPLRIRLVPADPRPKIEIIATDTNQTWTV
jgi:Uma2 family endonuclease